MNKVDYISKKIKGVDVQVKICMDLSPELSNEFLTKHEDTITIPYTVSFTLNDHSQEGEYLLDSKGNPKIFFHKNLAINEAFTVAEQRIDEMIA